MGRSTRQQVYGTKLPLRNHFRKDGKPKKSFTSKIEADKFAPGASTSYHCSFCNNWHLASKDW